MQTINTHTHRGAFSENVGIQKCLGHKSRRVTGLNQSVLTEVFHSLRFLLVASQEFVVAVSNLTLKALKEALLQ